MTCGLFLLAAHGRLVIFGLGMFAHAQDLQELVLCLLSSFVFSLTNLKADTFPNARPLLGLPLSVRKL